MTHEECKNGQRYGRVMGFYPGGELRHEYLTFDGSKEGRETYYWRNRRLNGTTDYKAGKKHGLANEYDENGRLIKESRFREGVLIVSRTF